MIAEFQRGMAAEGQANPCIDIKAEKVSTVGLKARDVFRSALGERRGVVVSRDITQRKQSEDALEAIVRVNVVPGSPNFFETLVRVLAKALDVPMVFCLSEWRDGGKSTGVGVLEPRSF